MSERGDDLAKSVFYPSVEFIDFYALTQSGTIRRVSIPSYASISAMVILQNRADDFREEMLDRTVCRQADKQKCTYAEAWVDVLSAFEEHHSEKFQKILEDKDGHRQMAYDFVVEQKAREQRWRTEHNDWREVLPPAVD